MFLPRGFFQLKLNPHSSALSLRAVCKICTSTSRNVFNDTNPQAAEAEKIIRSIDQSENQRKDAEQALRLVTEAMKQSSVRAKTVYASMQHSGIGLHANPEEALRLFEEAAVAGDPIAQCTIGVLQLDQINLEESEGQTDSVESSEFYVDVDEKGEMKGQLNLIKDGETSSEDAPSPAELVRRVRKARRKAGFTDMESREFEEHRQRERKAQLDERKLIALDWLEKATEQGNDDAMVALGDEIFEKNPSRAVQLYEEAVSTSRNTDAYYNLGRIFYIGAEGIPADEKRALKNFGMAAQLGNAEAQFYMGHLYQAGSSEVEIDHASSRQYIELAAKQGHSAALYYLALMHRNGLGGLEPSLGAFRRFLRESADAGHGPAHVCLADMHYKGIEGVDVDYEKALEYYLKAGKLGEADAYCSAAAMLFHGFGTEEDHHEAFLLYQEAAQHGSVKALRNIGSMYFHGQGVPSNKVIAEHFLRIADETEAANATAGEEHLRSNVENVPAPPHPMGEMPEGFREKMNDQLPWDEQVTEIVRPPPAKDSER